MKNKKIVYKNKEWLFRKYIEEELSSKEIGESINIDPLTIRRWLKRFNIPIRSYSDAQKLAIKKGNSPHIFTKKDGFKKGNPYRFIKGNTPNQEGPLNPNWNNIKKNAKSCAIHVYIKRRMNTKPIKCPECNSIKNIELSFDHSLGEYTRNIDDYKWLCHSCHMKRDWAFGLHNNKYTKNRGILQ